MRIARARAADAAELFALNEAFNGAGANSLEGVRAALEGESGEVALIASDGGRIVGFCCGRAMRSVCYSYGYAEITELYVIERRRREGIGARLLEAMESELTALGARHFHILTGAGNAAAKSLYSSRGYRGTDEVLLDKNID